VQLDIRLTAGRGTPGALALPVFRSGDGQFDDELAAFLAESEHQGGAGETVILPRPLREPHRVFLIGVGNGNQADWRAFGAAVTRSAARETSVTVELPTDLDGDRLRALVEGLQLAAYRFRVVPVAEDKAPKLRRVHLIGPVDSAAVDAGMVSAEMTVLIRDWVNTHSAQKSPAWLAHQIEKTAAKIPGIKIKIREPKALAAEGFGGILAVGAGSSRGPRLVELSWAPTEATKHVVLVGKGITFDTGGISIKSAAGMLLMRKDMGDAAAVTGALFAAAKLKLPIKITVLAPLAENSIGGSAFRPGDIVRHYGGTTSEILNTDAEGRVVLADALSYAVHQLQPDLLIDLATLTGAQNVALGKRTAALYSDNDVLADSLTVAGTEAGEQMWRLPLPDDYVDELRSDVADWVNSTDIGAGSVLAALYLREFTGEARTRWAHLDMSSVAWSDGIDKELARGATGWGVRTLLRFLETEAGR
jgi:leucyl aminopeptidase